MRLLLTLLLSISTTCFSTADEPKKAEKYRTVKLLWVRTAEVGDYGPIAPSSNGWHFDAGVDRTYTVVGRNGPKQIIIREESGYLNGGTTTDGGRYAAHDTTLFMIEGMDASKVVSGRSIELDGWYRVIRTAKQVGGSRTILVLQPESEAEKKVRAERRQKLAEEERKRQLEVDRIAEAKKKAELQVEAERRRQQQIKDRETKAAADAARNEKAATNLLRLARIELDAGKDGMGGYKLSAVDSARKTLESLLKDYPKSKAAVEARKLLKSLGK